MDRGEGWMDDSLWVMDSEQDSMDGWMDIETGNQKTRFNFTRCWSVGLYLL